MVCPLCSIRTGRLLHVLASASGTRRAFAAPQRNCLLSGVVRTRSEGRSHSPHVTPNRPSPACSSFDCAPNAVALNPNHGRHAIAGANEVCQREAFLMAVPCVVTLDFAGGSGHRLLGTSLPVTHSYQTRTTAKSVAQRSFSPSADQRRGTP
jgi:hypothetical protein